MSDQETASITVLRTCDAKKAEFQMQMSGSLNDLKDTIAQSDAFGPLPRDSQRIFHLGRELKTGGRSLSALGLGRFRVFTVHLMAKKGQGSGRSTTETAQPPQPNNEVVVVPKRRRRNRLEPPAAARGVLQPAPDDVIELSDDDDDVVVEVTVPAKRQRTRR